MTMKSMPIHPAADLFPMLPASELQALADDIKANGQREPVVLWEGSVLDGRNRLAACRLVGVEPLTRTLDACPDPLAFVLSLNLRRRHLSTSQLAMVAGRVAAQIESGEISPGQEGRSREIAARLVGGVEADSVKFAIATLKHGIPELVDLVDQDKLAVSVAAKAARFDRDRQRELVAKGAEAVREAVKAEVKPREPKSSTATAAPATAAPAPTPKTPGQVAEEKIHAAATVTELDAAYQEASKAGLTDRECEAVADARQERGAALRAQAQTTAPAPVPAAAQPAPVEVSVPVAPPAPPPTPPRGQVDLFTQPSVAVFTQDPASQPVSTETVTVSKAEWEALQAEVAEARGLLQWKDGIAARAGAGDEASVGKVMRLIALSGSPNQHEAASAALKACRMIRERGLLVVTSVAASGNVEVSEDVFEAMSRATAASWDRFEQRLDDIFNARRGSR